MGDYFKEYVGEFYEIEETLEKIFISGSFSELIHIVTNRKYSEHTQKKHEKDAETDAKAVKLGKEECHAMILPKQSFRISLPLGNCCMGRQVVFIGFLKGDKLKCKKLCGKMDYY